MNDFSYIFGINPVDRPEIVSPCLASKILAENVKRPDGARLWWLAVADRVWERTLQGWAKTPTLAEQQALRRRWMKHWLQPQDYGFSSSFCRNDLVQGDCANNLKCTYGLTLACGNCRETGVLAFHASKKGMIEMGSLLILEALPRTDKSTEPSVLDSDAPQGIFTLPSELICAIFSLTRTESCSSDRTPAPVHTLTRVCRFWRSLAQELPELWTDIQVVHCWTGQLERLSECLRRSKALPLDIIVDIRIDVVGNRQLANFWPIVLKIWSVAHRWRVLCITTTGDNFASMQYNVGRKAAPCLESLELFVSESSPSLTSQPTLFFGSMPVIKSLVLNGITLDTSEASSLVGQLETLNICSLRAADLITQLAEVFETATETTHDISPLRHLTICGQLPKFEGTPGALVKTYISSLTSLTLAGFHAGAYPLFYLTPLLEELSLTDLNHVAWQTFADSLGSGSLTFPALRILKLKSIVSVTLHEHFSRAFPALEYLSLLDADNSTFFAGLSWDEPVLWPGLHTLTLNNANYRALCAVVEARIALGHPLAALEVGSPQFIDARSLQWLQKHVTGFKRNLRA
ncbi:hypothetical protein FB451DRAFT_1185544 [Mycena latifolia]|nr:hypothetical protein FB451DRAFT_1185544 [Mycena latifolia]